MINSTNKFDSNDQNHINPSDTPTKTYKAEAWEFGGLPYFSSGKQLIFPFSIDERLQKLAYQISSLTWREVPGHPYSTGRLTAPIRHLTDSEIELSLLNKKIQAQNNKILTAASVQAYEESNLIKAATRRGLPSEFNFACGRTIPTSVAAWGKSDPTELVCRHFQGTFEVLGEHITYFAFCEGDKEVVQFCIEKLANCVQDRLLVELEGLKNTKGKPSIIQDALAIATVDLNNLFPSHEKKTFKGASLNAAFMYESILWLVNLGNARAQLAGPGGDQYPLSTDNPSLRIGLPKATRADVCFIECPKESWKDWHLIQTSNGVHKKSAERAVALKSVDLSLMLHRLHNQDSFPLLKVASEIIIAAHESGGTGNLFVGITPLGSIKV